MDEATIYCAHSATLRIVDAGTRHDEITRVTGLVPSRVHRKGEVVDDKTGLVWPSDYWAIKSPLPKVASMTTHLAWLWVQVEPHADYFRRLIREGVHMHVYCKYVSNNSQPRFSVEPEGIRILHELGVPIEVAVIVSKMMP